MIHTKQVFTEKHNRNYKYSVAEKLSLNAQIPILIL